MPRIIEETTFGDLTGGEVIGKKILFWGKGKVHDVKAAGCGLVGVDEDANRMLVSPEIMEAWCGCCKEDW